MVHPWKLISTILVVLTLVPLASGVIAGAKQTTPPVESIYAKYLFKAVFDVGAQGSYSNRILFTITLNFTEDKVEGELRLVEASGYLVSPGAASPTITTIKPGPGKGVYRFTVSKNEYYEGVKSGISPASSVYEYGALNPRILMGIVEEGATGIEAVDYNGYPAIHESFHSSYTSPSANITVDGEIYLHEAYILPLYSKASIVMDAHIGLNKTHMNATLTLELLDTNMPRTASHAAVTAGTVEIIAGGLPGAEIVVKGSKGSSVINVTNKGTDPGYVIVFFKKTSLEPIGRDGKGLIMVNLAPGETRTIDIGIQLPGNVEASTKLTSGAGFLSDAGVLVLILLVIGLIALLGLIIYRAVRPKTAAETVEETGESAVGSGEIGPTV